MAGSPSRGSAHTPGDRHHLRTVLAAAFVGVAVAVLLILVAVFQIAWVEDVDDTPPIFKPPMMTVPAHPG
ncbi:hypothetical protein C6A87_021410 [Mycobacterium sp. ITM-2016-00317]|uniref:hypothetical protein n=1 Tax=Mycobacterium sp. ITM-2016-00317 TaxID=2099694 RepID=UPI000D3F731B|nr:hypothetical protein [Mycobacterium sp. ITM-2016-00317]WNG86390.1 hypothetical protein C6A87_021410 [Mycobacterium sp. ITM-2016-00317]